MPKRKSPSDNAALIVVYHPKTGEVVHFHYSAAEEDVKLPGKQAREKEAVDYMKRHVLKRKRLDLRNVSFLHLDPTTFRMDRAHKVDIESKTLVEVKKGSS